MKGLWMRLLVLWYRLTGSTPTQAEWRARQARQAPQRAKGAVAAHTARAVDGRFTCVCGQLLTEGDKVCHACGRRQLLPGGVRKVVRLLGLSRPSATLGTLMVGLSMVIGFVIQLRLVGTGALTGALDGLSMLEAGAWSGLVPFEAQPWRAVTYTMVHGGLMHIAFNGIALMQIGPIVERWIGFARFMFVWVAAGIAGVVGPQLLGMGTQGFVVGASGAVFGLIGVALVLGHRSGTPQGRAMRDAMVKWVIYATIFGFMMGGVAHTAHFGGLFAGGLVAFLLAPSSNPPLQKRLTPLVGVLGLGTFLASVGGLVAWQLSGAQPPAAVSEPAAAEWLVLRSERDGLEAVLPPAAVKLANEAQRMRRANATQAEIEAYIDASLTTVLATLTGPQKQVLVIELRDALGIATPRPQRRPSPHGNRGNDRKRSGTADMP